jgi:hypothetical protein
LNPRHNIPIATWVQEHSMNRYKTWDKQAHQKHVLRFICLELRFYKEHQATLIWVMK